jgi:hypothetical protein
MFDTVVKVAAVAVCARSHVFVAKSVESLRTRRQWRERLNRRVEFRGESGATYSFLRLEGEASLRPIGVTYVIADCATEGWRLLGVGHTSNLAEKRWAEPLSDVRKRHPSAELLIRLNINRSIREAEAADLQPRINPSGPA